MHLFKTLSKLSKLSSNEDPYTVKLSINTSMHFSRKSLKMLNMHRWNVPGALHRPNGILLWAKVPKGQVNVVFSWSSGVM